MSEWDVLKRGLAEEEALFFVAQAALLAVLDCGPGHTAGMPALWPRQHCGHCSIVARAARLEGEIA